MNFNSLGLNPNSPQFGDNQTHPPPRKNARQQIAHLNTECIVLYTCFSPSIPVSALVIRTFTLGALPSATLRQPALSPVEGSAPLLYRSTPPDNWEPQFREVMIGQH
jgi:hypothetical protein